MKDIKILVDNLLGKVTMYRAMIYGLLIIAIFALLLMVSGYLAYHPLSFIISLIVCVGVSYGANKIIGRLFGLHSHAESAIITGLIVALIFSPPATLLGGVKLALVVVIAQLSKYLLVIHSKHIFNPVAIATVIAAVSGLLYASWWVATPGLLPVTVIVSLLMLYKTQKLQMGLTFFVVAIFMVWVNSDMTIDSFGVAITSWPLVFFAGIMLSEPLTLAPRRWQQLIIAVLVALLLPLDFHYGNLSMTPALALVIGNAIAFWFGVRRTVKLRLVATKKQGRDGYELLFDVTPIHFTPGQYIELTLPHHRADNRGVRRVFSIIGHPDDGQLAVATRVPPRPSSFKRALMALKPGMTIYGTRVAGDFILPDDPDVPIVCIAGGVGVTPYISFLQAGGKHDITLLYSLGTIDDMMFVDELKRYDVKVVVISPDDTALPDGEWRHEKGHLSQDIINRYVASNTQVYISGPPSMVTTTREFAKQAGAKAVHTDSFSGY